MDMSAAKIKLQDETVVEAQEKLTPIYFHLETTGFEPCDQVILIQLLSRPYGTLEIYIKPDLSSDYRAYQVNQFSTDGDQLYKRGVLIENTYTREKAWEKFIEFIKAHTNPVLVCFNLGFHGRFIRQEFEELITSNMAEKLGDVCVVDSMTLSKRKMPGLKSYSFQNMTTAVKNIQYDNTNTEMKVFVIKSIVKHLKINSEDLHSYKQVLQDYLAGKRKRFPNKTSKKTIKKVSKKRTKKIKSE